MKALISTVLFLALIVPAFGQARVCGERSKMIKHLAEKYKENPRALGIAAGGKSVLEIYTSNEGTWTVIMTSPKGVTCIMGAGHSWQDHDMVRYLPKT